MSTSSLKDDKIILWVDVSFAALFALVVILGFMNSYLFLYRQERYKTQPLLVLFYFFAQVACMCRLAAYLLSIFNDSLLVSGTEVQIVTDFEPILLILLTSACFKQTAGVV